VFEAFLNALTVLSEYPADLYADIVLAVLPAAAREYLEELMTTAPYRFQSDFARRYFSRGKAEGVAEGKAEGRAEGEADAVLTVLAARGIQVSDEIREHITSCTDLEQLSAWLRRAITVTTAGDLFS
jgi:hypothetical protein